MTLKDAKTVKPGTVLQHRNFREKRVVAIAPAEIHGPRWRINVDGETSTRTEDGKYWITGLKGHLWDVVG